jgi:adenosine deaminase
MSTTLAVRARGRAANGRAMLSPEAIRRLPKVQLHCHLEGTLRAQTFRDLARHYGVDIGARGQVALEETYAFATFGEFLLLFAEVCKVLRTPDDFARLAGEYARDAAGEGVAYAEVFISPSVWTFFHPTLDVRATVAAMREAFHDAERTHGTRVALIADLTRNFGPERALATARQAIGLQDLGVIGIGLGGDEARFPPALFIEAYAAARDAGLHVVAHAGEAAGPQSVRDAIDLLGAERIGHGVRALQDATLVAELARRSIPLEVCPTSNRLTGAAPPGFPHPIVALAAAGVRCVIDADDPALFGTTLCDEYALVRDVAGDDALLRFARNAVDASFAGEREKRALHARFDAFSADFEAVRRTS